MMDGAIVRLTPRQQEIIARWVVKTVLVITIRDQRAGAPVIEQMRVRLVELMKDGTPSDDTTVRIAYVSDEADQSGRPFLPVDLERGYEIGAVFPLPHLLCETLTGPRPIVISFIEATQHDDRLIRIWPPQITDALWPPSIPLSLADAEALKAEWDRST